MPAPPAPLSAMLGAIEPVLHDGVYVYTFSTSERDLSSVAAVAMFREAEGTTLITTEDEARRAGLKIVFRAAWITLGLDSALAAVGLTAAVSRVLADAGISCNVLAATCHDHLFVPVDRGQEALSLLKRLQREASG